jgi:hypothetical protein
MLENPKNAPTEELRERLKQFAAWRYEHLKGDEKGEAQVYLDRLFQALGWAGVFEAGASLEFRIKKNSDGGTSFADLLWKPRVLIEMKKAGADLSRHLSQAFNYWIRAVPNRPRYVILCNFDEFWIYDFDNQVDEPVEKFNLTELFEKWESIGFMLPRQIEPLFGHDLVAVTREAAADVAKVFISLRDRGVDPVVAQKFSLQCVMAMFSEDIGLLPAHFFTNAVTDAKDGVEAYDLIGNLFKEMNSPGITAGGRYAGTPYFNGGLFTSVDPQELTHNELALLRDAASNNWSNVRPEIFGTLFEGSMDAGERHASGAHFTAQSDIIRIVAPVIVEPWKQRINAATSISELNGVLEAMSQFRVLDPSVGSGNFLYVAYRELRRLEREAIEKIRDRRRSENIAGQESFGYVTPEQFFGMDVNEFAVEVAKITMLLGRKLADDEMHEIGQTLPLNNLDKNIVHADALFTPWPAVDAIIGNPPYLGGRAIVDELGADYRDRLNAKFGPRGVADFVTYWFPLAHDHLPEGGRAGFVATKSVKHGDGRKASLDYVVDNGGAIIDAVSSMAWSGEAAVTISIVNWQKGGVPPKKRTLWLGPLTEPLELEDITAALSPEIDLRSANDLVANRGRVFQGQTAGVIKAFRIGPSEARKLSRQNPKAASVIHPFLGGDEMLKKVSINDWIVDLPDKAADTAWQAYPAVMKYLESTVLPVRDEARTKEILRNEIALAANPKAKVNRHHQGFYDRWWTLSWRREEYLAATSALDRYLAISGVASENRIPVVAFISGKFHVSNSMFAFPFADDYSLGILQSNVHETWFRERCSTLETRLRYTSQTVFDSFPWPQDPTQSQVDRVVRAAVAVNEYRGRAFKNGYSLVQQYDVLRTPGKSELRDLHAELDGAVLDAYNFDQDVDLLVQILELNLLLAQREQNGEVVTPPGPRPTAVTQSTWRWPAPSAG